MELPLNIIVSAVVVALFFVAVGVSIYAIRYGATLINEECLTIKICYEILCLLVLLEVVIIMAMCIRFVLNHFTSSPYIAFWSAISLVVIALLVGALICAILGLVLEKMIYRIEGPAPISDNSLSNDSLS